MSDPRVDEAMASGRVPRKIPRETLEKNQDMTGIVSIAVVTTLATLFVVCRLLSRRYVIKRFGLGIDDGMALASLVAYIPFAALCIQLINLGTARTPEFIDFAIDDAQWETQQIFDSIAHMLYATALVLCRVSGLAFYYRICALHKEFLVAIHAIFAVLVAGYLAQMCLVIFHCQPVSLLWAPTTFEDSLKFDCLDWVEIYGAISGISLICDLLLFGLPVAMLKALDMPRKRKVQLACILLPGIAVVGISISRISFVIAFQEQTPDAFDFAFLRLLIVEVSEIGATLIALSIPGVKPLVDKYILRKDIGSQSGGSRTCSNRDSIGSQSSSLSFLKGSRLSGLDSTAQYGAAVSRGERNEDVKQEGIQVTVDVCVQRNPEERHPDERHPEKRHPGERHPEQRHPEERYPEEEHPEEEHPEERHPEFI
ncbi:hypothetical protein G6O67_006294 [Ophiocordyceps sinensis]|uniref:Rhodopsin domain-containing protein n=2 Tax=Ophiocordyceps sinensis TaxID=72228 RepID=A0A8H4LVD7_9HYPO|nr:protein related to integral membrane protein pth11 [Ophiocordyceps sinensis CO18]KAF4506188.1 hypothetical protein G6O67_006294 [Ophiocordyceps sinensis]